MKRTLLYFITSLFFYSTAQATSLPGPVVDSVWLAKNQNKIVILDVRADLESFTRQPVFIKDKNAASQN